MIHFFNFIRSRFFAASENKLPHLFSVNINLEHASDHKIIRKYRIEVAAHDKNHARRILANELKVVVGGATKIS